MSEESGEQIKFDKWYDEDLTVVEIPENPDIKPEKLELTEKADKFLNNLATSVAQGALDKAPRVYMLGAIKWSILGGIGVNLQNEAATSIATGKFFESVATIAVAMVAVEGAKYVARKYINSRTKQQ